MISHIYGMRVVVRDPIPVFKKISFFKKHRKKRCWTPRVRVFSHYFSMVEDGQVIGDGINNVLYMNSNTYRELQKLSGTDILRGNEWLNSR